MSERSIAAEIEGLRGMSRPDLVRRFQELWGYEPRILHRAYLFRRCAWKVQELRLGGLSPAAQAKLDELIADLKLPLGNRRSIREAVRAWPQNIPKPGSVLVRPYRGQEIRVTVREDGFEWEGLVYRSLSAIARAATNTRWNGKAFFGLTPRRKVQ